MGAPLIGALRVSLSAETAAFEAGMKRAQRTTATAASGMSKSLGTIKTGLASLAAGLSVGLFVNAIKSSLDYAGSLGELASTLGLTTRDLQEFRFAAGQVGISQDELENGIQKLTISMGKAQLGAEAQVKAFNAIGISVDDLNGKDAGQVFRLIAEKLETVSDRSKRAAVEVALFGKAGAKLDNLLSGAQGGLNELSDAAERLGIVLSDEQIQKADETADKLEAMQTVLKAQIAGVVADNADAILQLANALSSLAATAVKVLGPLSQVFSLIASTGALAVGPGLFGLFTGGGGGSSSQTLKLPPAHAPFKAGNIGKFLGGGGGGGGSRKHSGGGADHTAEKAAREANQFDQEIRRANIDILRAKKDLAADYVEQTSIAIEIKDEEKAAYEAELAYRVASKDLTKAQADKLRAANDSVDALERTAILDEEQAKRAADFQELQQHDFDRQREILEARSDLAETASERRKIELELLRIAYEQKKQALQNVIDTSKDFKEIEDARRDLATLNATQPLARQGVINSTRGPLESFMADLPGTTDKINEALQSIEVDGLGGLTDALTNVLMGTESLKDAFHDLAASVLADLIKMTIKMLLFRALTAAFGGGGGDVGASASAIGNAGLPGFATGGSFFVGGRGGTDNNILALNGLPIARVSYGERVNIANDDMPVGGMGGVNVTLHNDFRGADPSAVSAIRARLDRMQAELPAKIVGTVKDAQSRFIIRK